MVAEALPDPALQPVAVHGAACGAARNSETESGMIHAVGAHNGRHDPGVQPGAAGEDLREIFPPSQPMLRPEPPIGGIALRQRVCVVPSHAAR